MRDTGLRIRVAELGVVLGLALQSAHAGDRKLGAAGFHARTVAAHPVVFAAQTRASGDNYTSRLRPAAFAELRRDYGVPGGTNEFSFAPVSPLKSEVRGATAAAKMKSESRSATREPTPPSERKTVRFFKLDSKLGDVSVQPVLGGVNGAQLSVGF